MRAVHTLTEGDVIDVPFPHISASADETEIFAIAFDCADKLCSLHPAVVMCQGEFGITFIVVNLLKAKGIRVIYSCSERRTAEKKTENGLIKTSEFSFVRFREY